MTVSRSARLALFLLALPVATACGDKGGDDTGQTTDGGATDGGATDGGATDGGATDAGTADGGLSGTDADADGVTVEDGDCDDGDASISPDATEICNGVDDNCDGAIDEGFDDTDLDGVADCVDVETCDGVDNNGDGTIDEGFDVDGDGVTTCDDQPDCDDGDAGRSPLLSEIAGDLVDNDCDLLVDEGDWAYGDLVISEVMINPLAVGDGLGEWFEVVNQSGRSVYLNGLTFASDTGETHTVDSADLLPLADGGYAVFGISGDTTANGGVSVDYAYDSVYLLNTSDTLSVAAGDVVLDDIAWGDETVVYSGSSLSVDDTYLSASGNDDAGGWCQSRSTWADGSDFGTPGLLNDLCSVIDHDGDGMLIDDGDCDDRDPTVYAGARDTWYDGVDSDCEGNDDYDADADGYSSDAYGGDDCDDRRDDINPAQDEICDDLDTDEDCNGLADTADGAAVDGIEMFSDADGDGYGSTTATMVCEGYDAFVSDSSDCDDDAADTYPGARDVWYDGVDSDCAGNDDYDADLDGHDSDAFGGDDCDDTRSDVNPDQAEICDDLDTDEDCNGVADDDDLGTTDAVTYYPDDDGDGYGSDADRFVSCESLSGWMDVGGDCDDSDADISPAATETWYDGVDQDCDGWSDYDADQDSYESTDWAGDDCDDTDRLVHPYAYEDPTDGLDNDCDDLTDSADTDTVTELTLADDDSTEISFDVVTVPFCDTDYTSVYVGSNGWVTFGVGSTSYSASASGLTSAGFPAVAGWWDDLNPSSAGTVLWQEFDDAVGIYFMRVTEYGASSNQTFSYLLKDDGSFILEYQTMNATSGVVGWSCGTGEDPGEVDLTAENSDLPDGSFGMGSGTDAAVYEVFSSDSDVADNTLLFCAQSGTDSDGDGWTDNCGDTDDTDDTVFPE